MVRREPRTSSNTPRFYPMRKVASARARARTAAAHAHHSRMGMSSMPSVNVHDDYLFASGVEDQALRAIRNNEHILFSMAPSSKGNSNNMASTSTAADGTTYGMSMDVPASAKGKNRRHRRGSSRGSMGGGDEEASADGSASLTYSAGSSIASSAAGESTDSSFADIMKVLDMQDSHELAAFMKREGVTDPGQYRKGGGGNKASTAVSVSSSLAYSTDGESALEGAHLLQTITGQPSDSYGPDGGSSGFGGDVAVGNPNQQHHNHHQFGDANILFAPADEPVKSKKSRKDRSSHRHGSSSSPRRTTSSGSSSRHHHKRSKASGSSGAAKHERGRTAAAAGSGSGGSNPSTPPPVPRSRSNTEGEESEDEVWYAKWWMCGFADSFRDLVPKR